MKYEIALTGSGGFIGSRLSKLLQENGYTIRSLNRESLYGDPGGLAEHLDGARAVIHLSGAGILRRWTVRNKELIYNSRIVTTKNLVEAICRLPDDKKPEVFISASAIGIYEPDKLHSENSTDFSETFLGITVNDWEKASEKLPVKIRRVVFRTGLVLDREALIIRKMFLPFRFGLGGKIGNGRQPFPFIHLADLMSAYIFALENPGIRGIINLVAPENITNSDFTASFSKLLKRPAFLMIPAWILKLIYGKASEILLQSPGIVPEKLLQQDFKFEFPTLEKTLVQIINKLKNSGLSK